MKTCKNKIIKEECFEFQSVLEKEDKYICVRKGSLFNGGLNGVKNAATVNRLTDHPTTPQPPARCVFVAEDASVVDSASVTTKPER